MFKQVSLKLIRDHSNSQISPLRLRKLPKHDDQVFLSKQQRFPRIKMIKEQIPGPGSYIDPLARSRQLQSNFFITKEQKESSKKNFSQNNLDGFVSREHQWIFGSDRLQLNSNGSGLGPGAYEIAAKNMQKSLSPNSWSKSDRFTGSEWSQGQTSLGPGTYNLQKMITPQRKKEMGVFKSKSPKTFIQELQKSIQKNMESKIQGTDNFEPLKNEDMQELQKLTNNQQKEAKKKKMDPVFLSRSKRYELINPQNSLTGPGAYQLDSQGFIKTKPKKAVKSVSVSHNYIRKKEQVSRQKPAPGPTSYQVHKFNMEKQIEKRISSLKGNMSMQTRWKTDWKKASQTIPGPGYYNRQRYVFINQKEYEHKPLVNHHQKIDVPFLSSSSRIVEDAKNIKSPFGNYNLNQFDMSQKIRKKRSHIEKLKAMDISVPGFESSQRRTTFNLGKLMKGLGAKLEGGLLQQASRVKSNSSLHKE